MAGSGMRRGVAVAAGSLVLVAGGLVAAGCGESTSDGDAVATVAADGTATLTFRDGQDYTVTMATGQTTPIDVYANDGGEPVSFFGVPSGAVDVTVGQPFAQQLPANPSTGYSWKVSGTAIGTVVDEVQQFQEPGNGESGEVGVPTQQVWVYRATAAGTGTLVYEEFPPGKDTPSKTYTVTVTVTE